MPEHALAGIKNDQKVIDVLQDITILYAQLSGFEDYYKNVKKPQEVMGLLNRLFSKFDILCEQYQVYKVHTIGDIYVIMSYTGKVAKEKRTVDDAVVEAYNILQVGLQMVEIVAEERKKLKDPLLRNLDIKIGINTGRIVGGIIGTKVARYDIFGQDVLIACLTQRAALPGSVLVSDAMRKMIFRKAFIYDTFDWQDFKEIKVPDQSTMIKTFVCEQIFAENDSSEEEYLDQMVTMKLGEQPNLGSQKDVDSRRQQEELQFFDQVRQ